MLTSAKPNNDYWTSQTLSTTNPGPVQWPQARPTLTGGLASGRVAGTPAQIARADDGSTLASDDNRSRSKNTPGHQSMRRTIQDLVASVDPNVKIEPEVEDVSIGCGAYFFSVRLLCYFRFCSMLQMSLLTLSRILLVGWQGTEVVIHWKSGTSSFI